MAKDVKKPARSDSDEETVVYRGIKIAPIVGKRSSLARAIRDGLRAKAEHGEPVEA